MSSNKLTKTDRKCKKGKRERPLPQHLLRNDHLNSSAKIGILLLSFVAITWKNDWKNISHHPALAKLQSHRRKTPTHNLSRAKRRLFLIFTLGFPFLLFLLLEIGLRVFQYGPNLSLFTIEEIAGKTYHIMDPDVKARYFSRVEFSPNTSPDYFLVPKPTGTFRIFCLGGSTTVGFPYGYVGSFSTFLRDRLKVLFPDRSIEVINLGMTATNSYTVVDIARELVNYQPDLLIVYDGHNEFYGALGIASHEALGGARWLSKAYLRLIHLRTFLLVRDAVTWLRALFASPPSPVLAGTEGTMMERLARGKYIPYGSKAYLDCLGIFKANLEDLKEIAMAHKIPVLISSQVANLRHQPPFISGSSSQLGFEQQHAFEKLFRRGRQEWEKGDFAAALTSFREASAIDSMRADVFYEIARCLDTLGRKQEARAAYIKARDYDELRFRTASDFNEVIRHASDGSSVIFVDIEAAFQNESPDSLIGSNLILEHLHPNTYGYFLMAREYAHAIRDHQFLAPLDEWASRDTVQEKVLWVGRTLTEIDEMCAQRRIAKLTSGWPFRPETVPLDPLAAKSAEGGLGQIVERMVRAELTWEQGHVAAAEFYERSGDLEKAEREYRTLANQVPLNVSPHVRLAMVLLKRGNTEEARQTLLNSLSVERTMIAYRALGGLALDGGAFADAILCFENALGLSGSTTERAENSYLLGVAYVRAGMADRAVAPLKQALTLNPQMKPAENLLRGIRAAEQNTHQP